MYFDYNKPQKSSFLYPAGKGVAKFLAPFVYETRCIGKENVPMEGPLIIAGNHIAFSDPAIVVANCPRTVHYMAKSELFERRLTALFMKSMNAFPVRRNYSDRKSLRYAQDILENGWALGIFPEGRTVKELIPTEAKTGVAYIAKKSGADVLPICLYRDPEDKRVRHGLTLRFGKVIKNESLFQSDKIKSEDIKKAAEIIMDEIKKLWEEEHCK